MVRCTKHGGWRLRGTRLSVGTVLDPVTLREGDFLSRAIDTEDLRGSALRPLVYRVALPREWGMGERDTDWNVAAPGYFAGTMTSRSLPDSAPQASPVRPSICLTSAPRRSEAKVSNFSVAGSNLTIALIDQSVSQTLS